MALFNLYTDKSYTVKYIAGLPEITAPQNVEFTFKEGLIEISTLDIFFPKRIKILPQNIVKVSLDQSSYQHDTTRVAGAVIGKFISGGVGSIIGSFIGGKKTTESKFSLTINIGKRDLDVLIQPSKVTINLYNEFITFLSKYEQNSEPQKISQSPTAPLQEINSNGPASFTIVEQLEKLHSLVEKGILTKEEFENQKKKLL